MLDPAHIKRQTIDHPDPDHEPTTQRGENPTLPMIRQPSREIEFSSLELKFSHITYSGESMDVLELDPSIGDEMVMVDWSKISETTKKYFSGLRHSPPEFSGQWPLRRFFEMIVKKDYSEVPDTKAGSSFRRLMDHLELVGKEALIRPYRGSVGVSLEVERGGSKPPPPKPPAETSGTSTGTRGGSKGGAKLTLHLVLVFEWDGTFHQTWELTRGCAAKGDCTLHSAILPPASCAEPVGDTKRQAVGGDGGRGPLCIPSTPPRSKSSRKLDSQRRSDFEHKHDVDHDRVGTPPTQPFDDAQEWGGLVPPAPSSPASIGGERGMESPCKKSRKGGAHPLPIAPPSSPLPLVTPMSPEIC